MLHAEIIEEFAANIRDNDSIASHMACIIVQFITRMHRNLSKFRAQEGVMISDQELIDFELKELRDCILDIEKAKEHLINGNVQ